MLDHDGGTALPAGAASRVISVNATICLPKLLADYPSFLMAFSAKELSMIWS